MTDTHLKSITEAEWALMRRVWADAPLTSRQLIDRLADDYPWQESTVKTFIGRLVDKGYLIKNTDQHPYRFQAAISEAEANQHKLHQLLDNICKKKISRVLSAIIQDYDLSSQDIDALVHQLQAKAKTAPESVPCQCPPKACQCQFSPLERRSK